jgi:hypothetical protein
VSRFPGKWELYDLDEDRTELHNLAPDHVDIVQHLKELYGQWADRVGVQPPKRQAAAGRNKAKAGSPGTVTKRAGA